MVAGIGDSFFVINNLDKESGFINVSYSGDPCMFVDCGRVNSDVTTAAAGKKTIIFQHARVTSTMNGLIQKAFMALQKGQWH